jgi:hypothetical protein
LVGRAYLARCREWDCWQRIDFTGRNKGAFVIGMPRINKSKGRLLLPGAGIPALLYAVITTLLHANSKK